MTEFFESQLDFILFAYAFSFFLLAAAAWFLDRRAGMSAIGWRWLAFSAALRGVQESMALLALAFGDTPEFTSVRMAVMGLSFLCLLEFGRSASAAVGARSPGRWVHLVFLALASIGFFLKNDSVSAFVCYALCLPGGVWAAAAMFRLSFSAVRGRRALVVGALALGVYSLLTGLIPPKADFIPASLLNAELFNRILGIPLQLPCAMAVSLAGVALWIHYSALHAAELSRKDISKARLRVFTTAMSLIIILILAGGAAQWMGEREAEHQKADLLSMANRMANVLSPTLIDDLSASPSDISNPYYSQLKEQLRAFRCGENQIRFVYVMRLEHGRPVFLADSEPPGSSDESPPGQIYDDATPCLMNVLSDGNPVVEGPVADRWGAWVSALHPIRDLRGDRIVAVLGVDRSAVKFAQSVAIDRLKALLMAALLCVAAAFCSVYWRNLHDALSGKDVESFNKTTLRWGPGIIVMLLGLVLTLMLFLEVRRAAAVSFEAELLRQANLRGEILLAKLNRTLDDMGFLGHFLELGGGMSRAEFGKYVSPMVDTLAAQAIEWIPRVQAAKRAEFEGRARRDGLPDFQFTERNSEGALVPDSGHAECFPVYFVEPVKGNETALGFDLNTNPMRRAAMEKARDLDCSVASAGVRLVQETGEEEGILLFHPIFVGNAALTSLEERRKLLDGYILGVFRVGEFMRRTFLNLPMDNLSIQLEDVSSVSGGRLLYSNSVGATKDSAFPCEPYQRAIDFATRSWRLTIAPTPQFVKANFSNTYLWTIPCGFLTAFFLALYFNSMITRRFHAEFVAMVRTMELAVEKELLLASESRFRFMFERNSAPMLLVAPGSGMILDANPAAVRFHGIALNELKKARFQDFDPIQPEQFLSNAKSSMDGERNHFSIRCRLRAGEVRTLEVHASPIDIGSSPLLFLIEHDVTDRVKAEEFLRRTEENLRSFFDLSMDFLFVLDGGGHILTANRIVFDQLGYREEQIVGHTIISLHPPETGVDVLSLVFSATEDGSGFHQLPLVAADGRRLPVETRFVKGRWDGKPAVFCASRDVSLLKISEEKFSKAFNMIDTLMAISTFEKGKLIDVNHAFLTTLGFRKADVFGKTPAELGIFSDADVQAGIVGKLFDGKEVVDFEVTIRTNGGGVRHGLFSAHPMDIQGQPFLLSSFKDITERKIAEAAKERHASILNSVLNSTPDLIFFKDVSGRYVGCNAAFAALVGQDKGHVSGHTDYDLFPKEQADFFRSRDKAVMETKQSAQNEEWCVYPDGRRILISTLKSAIHLPDGTVIGVLGISRDITETSLAAESAALTKAELVATNRQLKTAIDDIHSTAKKAAAANLAKSQFIANMGHETRTLLNVVLGFAELIAAKPDHPQRLSLVNSVLSGGKSLLAFVNDILDLSKLEAGKMAVRPRWVDPRLLLSEIQQIFSSQAERKKLDFQLIVDETLPKSLMIDDLRLRQILMSLLANAIKFTDKGHVALRIQSKPDATRKNHVNLVIEVEDSGVGVQPDHLPVIFEPFLHFELKTTAKHGGAGVGLTLCRRLVELLGGRIHASSELGNGSVFSVELNSILSSQSLSTDEWKSHSASGNATFPGSLAVVVDDSPSSRRLISEMLKLFGVKCLEADNGLDAVRIISDNRPDIVFMDLNMPILSGEDAARELRSRMSSSAALLAVTADERRADSSETAKLFDRVLVKPVSLETLAAELKRVMRGDGCAPRQTTPSVEDSLPHLLSDSALSRLPEILRSMEIELEVCSRLRGQINFTRCKELAGRVKKLAQTYGLERFDQWADGLLDASGDFDSTASTAAFDQFQSLVDELQYCNSIYSQGAKTQA